MRNKKSICLYILTVIVGIISFNEQTLVISANVQTDAMQEAEDGLVKAPNNLGLDPNLFTKGDFSGYVNTGSTSVNKNINNANLVTADNRTTAYSSNPFRAIRLGKYKNEAGAIWSNKSGNNYVDITKLQTLSAWLYFGPRQHINAGDGIGDGMALVLQNSPDGLKAFAHKGNAIVGGENIGTWGIDNDKKISDPAQIASTAIQNSWALEFDTNANSGNSAPDFDAGIVGQHMANGFPGYSSTYELHGSYNNYYYSMDHQDVRSVPLSDGEWHHLTLKWDPTKFQITYVINDKNPDGTLGAHPVTVQVDHVPAAAFGGHEALKAVNNKVLWGFTASNGEAYEANLVAFESIPSATEANITTSVTDNTQNKTFKEPTDGNKDPADNDRTVNSGDNLTFNYQLQYLSGNNKWDNNKATIDLPKNITYTNGNANQIIGYVIYDDGSPDTAEPIYASEIDANTGKLVHTVGKALSSGSPKKATIKINGTANDVTSNTDVAIAHANFSSPVLITDANTPDFVIQKSKPISLAVDQKNISVDADKTANITGTVSYGDGTGVTNSNVKVHATVNNKALDTFALSDDTNLDNTTSGKLSFNIPDADLTQETNTLKVYVVDDKGNHSTTSTVIITKTGGLALKVDNYNFGPINQVADSMLIQRKGVWNIIVNDTRKNGTTTPWNLSATTSGLSKGDTAFKGNVIYRNSNGLEKNISDTSKVLIASGYKSGSGLQSTNIGQTWNSSDGIMLRSKGINEAGNYSGKMNWILADTL